MCLHERITLYIGIDFGTSTTVIKYRYSGQDERYIQAITDPKDGRRTIPTVVYYPQNEGEPLFGLEAEEKSITQVEPNIQTNFKIHLKNMGSPYFAQSAQVLRDYFNFLFKLIYDSVLHNGNYDDVVVYLSVPAKWTNEARNFMRDEFYNVGFGELNNGDHNVVVEIIDEPTAATYYLLYRESNKLFVNNTIKPGKVSNVLLLDMGAGTSDIVLFQAQIQENESGRALLNDLQNVRKYPRNDNNILCGGSEIDRCLQMYLRDLVLSYADNLGNGWNRMCSIQSVKAWKETMSSDFASSKEANGMPPKLRDILTFRLEENPTTFNNLVTNFKFTESDFINVSKHHWEKLNDLIKGAISEYKEEFGISAADIDIVLLTGGHSSWHFIKDLFNGNGIGGKIGKDNGFTKLAQDPVHRILQGNVPSETVALGMCMQDLGIKIPSIATNNVFIEIIVNDSTTGPIPIIEKGTELPISKDIESPTINLTKTVIESHKFNISLKIYEGTDANPENCSVKTMEFSGDSILKRFFKGLFTLITHLPTWKSYRFKVGMKVEMRKDQCLYFNGKLYVNDKPEAEFTEKDFERPTDENKVDKD